MKDANGEVIRSFQAFPQHGILECESLVDLSFAQEQFACLDLRNDLISHFLEE